jgi:PTS system fructose-specific IIA component
MVTSNISGIHELLSPETVCVRLPGTTKSEILEKMLGLLDGHSNINDFEGVRESVLLREDVMSTGVGKGLALPHAKTPAVDGIAAAFATTAEPIEYGSIDNLPVRLLFLVVSTEGAKTQHIKLLSRISRLMNEEDFRVRLLEAETPEEVITLFQQGELGLP